jgi:hypothetical protein
MAGSPRGGWADNPYGARTLCLSQHPDGYGPEHTILLAINQEFGEGPALRIAPDTHRPFRPIEVGEYQYVEELGAGSGAESVEPLAQDPLVGSEINEHTQWRKLELVARVADRIWGWLVFRWSLGPPHKRRDIGVGNLSSFQARRAPRANSTCGGDRRGRPRTRALEQRGPPYFRAPIDARPSKGMRHSERGWQRRPTSYPVGDAACGARA